jgi:tight adherence protein B
MALVGATAHLGGDVPAALRAARAREPVVAEHLDRLAGAWALAERHGIALAGPAAAVARDLRVRARVAGGLRARLAGPRATAAVLAGLPVLGLLLGEGIGARPWAVLTGGLIGQVLLVVGVGLVCAGLAWTERIVAGVAR